MAKAEKSSPGGKATPVVKTPALTGPYVTPSPLGPKAPPAPKENFKPVPKDRPAVPLAPKPTPKRTVFDSSNPLKVDTRPPLSPPAPETPRPLGSLNRFKSPPTQPVEPKPVTDHPDFVNGGRTKMTPADQALIIKNTQSGKLSKMQVGNINDSLKNGEIVPASIVLNHLNIPLGNALTKALGNHLSTITDAVARSTALKALNIKNYHIFGDDPKARADYIKRLNHYTGSHLSENASDAQLIDAVGTHHANEPKGWEKLNPFRDGADPGKIISNVGENYVHPLFNDLVVAPAHIGLGAAKGVGAVAQEVTRGGALNPLKPPPESADPVGKYLKSVAAGEEQAGHGFADMAKHPGKALQNDPLGSALAGVTLGESAIAKAVSLAGRAGDTGKLGAVGEAASALRNKQNFTPREVPLTDHATANVESDNIHLSQSRVRQRAHRAIQDANKQHAKEVSAIEKRRAADQASAELYSQHGHSHDIAEPGMAQRNARHDEDLIIANRRRDMAVQAAKAQRDATVEMNASLAKLHELGAPLHETFPGATEVPGQVPMLDRGFYSPKLATRAVEHLTDKLTPKSILMEQAVKQTRLRTSAQGEAKVGKLLRDMQKAGKDIPVARQVELLHTDAQGVTHGDMVDLFSKQLEDVRSQIKEGKGGKRRQSQLARTERNLQAQIRFHSHPSSKTFGQPPTEAEKAWLESARAVADHRTQLLSDYGALTDVSGQFRNYETAIVTRANAGDPFARNILDAREHLHKLEGANPELRNRMVQVEQGTLTPQDLSPVEQDYLHASQGLSDSLLRFEEQHAATSETMAPFRVPREAPKPANPFSRGTQPGDINPTLDFNRVAGKTKFTTSKQLLTGNYVPSRTPLVGDALKAQKAASGVDFVNRILKNSSLGVVHVPRAVEGTVGQLVRDPENFVLRNVTNLRRQVKAPNATDANLSALTDPTTAQSNLDLAYKQALVDENLTAETPIPQTSRNGVPDEYVLIPRAVDQALKTDLSHRASPEWVNRAFRATALYSRPGYAVRNIAQNIPLGLLEAGPVGLTKGLIKATQKDRPMVAGVDQHGLFGSMDRSPTPHALTPGRLVGAAQHVLNPVQLARDLRSFDWRALTNSKGGTAAAGEMTAAVLRGTVATLTDTVRALARGGENWTRRGIAHAAMSKEARALTQRMHSIYPDVETALHHIAEGNRPEAEAAANRVMDALANTVGEYGRLPKFEKLSAVVPFYRWYLHVGTLMLKLPFKYPVANQVIQGLGNVGAQTQRDLGQDFHSRSITDVPIAGPLTNAETINSEAGNPLTSALDTRNNVASLSPLFTIFADTVRGIDQYGNQLKDSNNQPLDATDKTEAILGQLVNLVPPIRLADQALHPGKRAPESIPLVASKPAYMSPLDTRLQKRGLGKPNQSATTGALNWGLGLGLNTKNVIEEEKQNVQKAKQTHRTYLRAKAKADRMAKRRKADK